jgi:type IV pilus assembly protein PilM
MPMMKNVLGLDLGSHTIKAVELRQALRGLEPVQMQLHPRAEIDAPTSDGGSSFAEGLARFIELHGLSTEHVVAALPSDRVSTRRLGFPFREKRKLAQAVPFELEGLIPFDLEDVFIDWMITGGERSTAIVAATVAQRQDVAETLGILDAAACAPRVLEAEGLSLANLASIFDLSGTRLVVDLGHRKTTVCLMVDEIPMASRSIPVGGLSLTRAMSKDLGLSLDDAEQLKCEEGLFDTGFNSRSSGALAHLDRIARELLRTAEAFEDVLGGPAAEQLDEITLVGGGARLHRIDEYLGERLGVTTRRISLPDDTEGAALVAGGDPVVFAPAIALALRGTGQARTHMNLRQGEFAFRTSWRQFLIPEARPTAIWAGVVLALLAATGINSILIESLRADRLEARAADIYLARFPGEAPSRPMAAMAQAVDEARENAEFLGLYSGNLSALDIMTELSARVPDDLKVRFEEVQIDRKVVRVKVAAENYEAADRLENVLSAAPPFEAASVSGQIKKNRGGAITFGINIPLEVEEGDS